MNIEEVKTITAKMTPWEKSLVEVAASAMGHSTSEFARRVLSNAANFIVHDLVERTEFYEDSL